MLCSQQSIRIPGYVYSATETLGCSSKFIFSSVLHIPTVVSMTGAMQNPKSGLEDLAVACCPSYVSFPQEGDTYLCICGLLNIVVVRGTWLDWAVRMSDGTNGHIGFHWAVQESSVWILKIVIHLVNSLRSLVWQLIV